MPSLQANLVKLILRLRPYGWAQGSIQEQRSRMEKRVTLFPNNGTIEVKPFAINNIAAEWIKVTDPQPCVVLYFHGGAYALGSVRAHHEFLSRLALATLCQVLAVNYRLAPEHPFPAALQDALFAYHWLLQQGWESSKIVLGGDSAGGGLALATVAALKSAQDPMPACAFGLSPWLDLTFSTESMDTNAKKDYLLSKEILLPYATAYAGEYARDYPLISPLFADLKGFCPVLIHVARDEIFLDEAVHFTSKAQAAGVDAKLQSWEGLFHVFQMVPFLAETRESLEDIAKFIKSQTQKS